MGLYRFEKAAPSERKNAPPAVEILRILGSDDIAGYETDTLLLGKLWAMFGEPDQIADEAFYSYMIAARTPDGRTEYLLVDDHSDRPSVMYAKGGEEAARALVDAVMEAQPADYELSYECGENFQLITYFVKGGKAGCRERALTIKEIFHGDPDPEDIEMFTALGYKSE